MLLGGEASSTGARLCPWPSICSECVVGTDANSRWRDAPSSSAVHDSRRSGPIFRSALSGAQVTRTRDGPALLDVRQMLDRLIGFDTTSRNSNLALIEFVRDYLDRLGIASELVFDATGAKANLFASIGPAERRARAVRSHRRGPGRRPGLVERCLRLRRARRPPVRARRRRHEGLHRDRARPRPRAQAAAPRRAGPLALTYDEEVGCKGVPACSIISPAAAAPPLGCVVGEPTGMRVANGHKGKAGYVCSVTGLASHSALNHLGVNAIEIGAAIITELRRLNDEFRAAGPFADGFEPPHCTVSTGVIAGGSALNIVPDHCRFEFEFRPLPGQDPDALFARIRDWAHPAADHARPVARRRHRMAGADELSRARRRGSSRHRGGVLPPDRDPGADQAGVRDRGRALRHARDPDRGVRPRRHQVAHKPDEYVELAQLERCTRFLRELVHATVMA